MSTKDYTCSKCTKRLANRHSLSRHKKNCQSRSLQTHFDFNDAPESVVRSEGWEIPILNKRSEVEKQVEKNPKIQQLLTEIVNGGNGEEISSSTISPKENGFPLEEKPPTVTDDMPIRKRRKAEMEMTLNKKPRTVGYSDDQDSDDDEQDEEKIVVPDTDEDLKDRFNHLFIEFTREKQYEHGHELAVLLDEMLDRGLVTPIEYNKLNSLIPPKSSNEEEEIEEGEDEMSRVIKDTVDYVIQHDKKELSDLLIDLRDEVGDEFLDALIELELLSGKFLENEFEDGEPLLPLIEEKRLKLEASPTPLSKLLRVKILLDDIKNNRHRVQEIFQRIDDADDNEEDIWKIFVREGLISDGQFEELSKLENTELEEISSILKGVKIGQGIPFLPTSLKGLRTMFDTLWKEFIKDGGEMMKNKLLPVLEELLRRGGITDEQFSRLRKELDKLL